ncbi:MAG: T9SS type A sorting domain-containing protein [Bacteroidota bacterium]
MLRRIPIFLFLCIVFGLQAQPVITAEVLPKIGDTLLVASDNLPESIAILGEGADQSWDLMDLQSAFSQKVIVQTAKRKRGSKPFSDADIRIKEIGGHYNFYRKQDHSLELLGRVGTDPMNMGVTTTTYFDQPQMTVHYPLKYGATTSTESSFWFVVPTEALPKEVLYALPITPDSVRYRCYLTENKEIDGWGTLALPDNTYEVLREKNIEERVYEVDIKVGDLPWQDITESVEDPMIQNKQVSQSYHFYSNELATKVAVAYMKPNGVNPKSVTYAVIDPTTTMRTSTGRPDVYAYPNPAITDVRFEFSDLKPSNYSLKIYNILGVVVKEENYQMNGFQTVKMDVSKLRKGTYLYSLSDEKGKTIATRRLMVIRP